LNGVDASAKIYRASVVT